MKRLIKVVVPFLLVAFLAAAQAHAQNLLPPPVKSPDCEQKIAKAKAAISDYQSSTRSWSGRWDRVTDIKPELRKYLEETHDVTPVGEAKIRQEIEVTYAKGKYDLKLSRLDKQGKVLGTSHFSGSDPEVTDILHSVQDMVMARCVNSWDYCSADNCFVSKSSTGWSAAYLDPAKGYVPTKLLMGNFKLDGAASTVFSDFKQDKKTGRWIPWKMVDTIRVPEQNVVGKIVTMKCLDFKFD